MTASAQCPVNIGFENGNFDGWECSIGNISSVDGTITLNPSPPVEDRHTIISGAAVAGYDFYGGFPCLCPNGSKYSIRLGNSKTNREAEQVSYTFTIPSNQQNFSIIYDYAVVFQNPNHAIWEQPKFTANVYNVTDNAYIQCSSFAYAADGNLPGFKQAKTGDTTVFYKDWTPVTIKLSGYAGKTIRLEFTTNDCSRGGHFGYAYIDVNEDCDSPISGNVLCKSEANQTLTAPYGFDKYRWFNDDFSQLMGTGQSLTFNNPLPGTGTRFAVEVTPYPDQGCIDTVYTVIQRSDDTINLNIPKPVIPGCITTGVDITDPAIVAGSSTGLKFAYYADSAFSTYAGNAQKILQSGDYYIKAKNDSGCIVSKKITVQIYEKPVTNYADSVIVTRPTNASLYAPLGTMSQDVTYSFWLDKATTKPVSDPASIVTAGTYYIKTVNAGGCYTVDAVTVVIKEPVLYIPNAFSPNGDGIHDTWEIPQLQYYPACVVDVYNRLGQRMFHSVGYQTAWDGNYQGHTLPVGTYYYVIRPSSTAPTVGGSITIVR
ncbi:MAG TPA: gliding motility-associated C-terminal domain-containing protein [Sediminibacterium sp.]|nr:gliding motility-associated C-terminal domain-containing protein [Sediminibacterium sp.]